MNIISKIKGLDKKTKINLSLVTLIVIVAIVAIVLFVVSKQTKEVAQIEPVEDTKVADVTEANIEFEYNEAPTAEAVALNIKEYDSSYNLYYHIQEVGQVLAENSEVPQEVAEQVTEEVEEQAEDTQNAEYKLYTGEPISVQTNSVISFKYEKNGIYSSNAYELQITNIIDEGEITEGATEEELKEANVDEEEKAKSMEPYYIKINYTANCITIYKKDESGNYTVPVKAMVCSTGAATPTKGVYKTMNKYVWKELNGHCWGQYSTRIVGHILFHSVPYSSPNHNALKYNLYDKLGTKASAGCIRLTTADAKWIYDNCALGTMVEFYSSSNPGPLGKPSAQKIVNVPECRSWDPTDPAPGNPWRTWNGQTTTQTPAPAPTPTTPAQPAPKPSTPNTQPTQQQSDETTSNTNSNTTNTNVNNTSTNTNTNTNVNTNTNSNTNSANTTSSGE